MRHDVRENKVESPPISLPEEGTPGGAPLGVDRTLGSAEPGLRSRPGASQGGVASTLPGHLPYEELEGTGLQHYT